MADIDYYPVGTGLSSLYDKSNLISLYRGEGAYDFIDKTPDFSTQTPWQGTWYTTSKPYASMFSDMQAMRGTNFLDGIGKNAVMPGVIRQLDVELPFGSYETSPNPTINQLLADKEFLKPISADYGTSGGNTDIIKVTDSDGNIKYVTRAQQKLTNPITEGDVFSLNYPKEFIDANARVNLPESIKAMLKYTYKTWTPDADYGKFKIPSWQMAKEMAQDIKAGSTGILSAYLNDVKRKYTPRWAKSSYFNNPVTRGGFNLLKNVGWAGDALLQGAALKDVYTGSSHVGDAVTNINRMMRVPFKDDGTVQTSIKDYKASLPKPKYAMPPKGAVGFNTGGIASLML